MQQQATILPMAAPVIEMLSPEEQSLVALFSHIIVEATLIQLQHESNQVPTLQQ